MSANPNRVVRLHAADNVVVARERLPAGAELPEEGIVCRADIPAGHKLATTAMAAGAEVRKYGQVIGFARHAIGAGEHVHVHNCGMAAFDREYDLGVDARPVELLPPEQRASFQGIVRSDGRVATRNYVGVLTSVNCSATVARGIADSFGAAEMEAYPNVDGVCAFVHGTGCGMARDGEGFQLLQRTLEGYARHPNFGGILLIGLGCEVNEVGALSELLARHTGIQLRTMTIQDAGGTRAAIHAGREHVRELLAEANRASRQTLPASHIRLALQCGGSDGYSGITANPALGAAVDLLVRHGGGAILSETPEVYGAEHLLTRRAVSREVGEKLIQRVRWWKDYTSRNGGHLDNNPSPGNREGGLTTILEKSLGAVAKAGTSNLMDVYRYAERVAVQGLVFMDSPGYDPCSVTGQIASGANIVCFTTGRGSVSGFKPAPSLKLCTNTPTYLRLREDMDLNCGDILDQDVSVAEMGQRIFDLILRTASGELSASEALGFGDNEFVPWQIGAVM